MRIKKLILLLAVVLFVGCTCENVAVFPLEDDQVYNKKGIASSECILHSKSECITRLLQNIALACNSGFTITSTKTNTENGDFVIEFKCQKGIFKDE